MIIKDNAFANLKYDLLENSFTDEHLRFHVMRVSAFKY